MSTLSHQKSMFSRYKGLAMALIGATLWGVSGTVAQSLFQHDGFRPGWLVTTRLLISGVLLLLLAWAQGTGQQIWNVWKNKQDRWQLIIFGILGMLGVQYTYFAAVQTGNAATATLLQYLGPVLITFYLALQLRRLPSFRELLVLIFALMGTFFLVTNGSLEGLSISGIAVTWGLISAVTAAFYILYPVKLLQKWGSTTIVGWGMVIGGISLSLVYPPWQLEGQHWSMLSGSFVAFVIVFGTLIPFYLYLDSLRYIKPSEAGILGSGEPLSAVILSIIWLQVPFGMFEIIGALCIMGAVTLLSIQSKQEKKDPLNSNAIGG